MSTKTQTDAESSCKKMRGNKHTRPKKKCGKIMRQKKPHKETESETQSNHKEKKEHNHKKL